MIFKVYATLSKTRTDTKYPQNPWDGTTSNDLFTAEGSNVPPPLFMEPYEGPHRCLPSSNLQTQHDDFDIFGKLSSTATTRASTPLMDHRQLTPTPNSRRGTSFPLSPRQYGRLPRSTNQKGARTPTLKTPQRRKSRSPAAPAASDHGVSPFLTLGSNRFIVYPSRLLW